MRSRVLDAWEDVTERHRTDEAVLVVSHGLPIRAIRGQFGGQTLVEEYCQSVQNCSVTIIDGTQVSVRTAPWQSTAQRSAAAD